MLELSMLFHYVPRLRPAAFTAGLIVLLAGCSSSDNVDAPKEISEQKSSAGISLDTPESELFTQGKRHFESQMFSLSRENFEALRTGYPIGPYAEIADLKIADCDFESSDYEAAAHNYEDFVKNRPASQGVPYALYRAALSYELANRGVGRDPSSLENASKLYARLTSGYPDSLYTFAALEHQKAVTERLGAHEKKIIDFYKKKEKESAATARDSAYHSNWDPKIKSSENAVALAKEAETAREEKEQPLPPRNEGKKEILAVPLSLTTETTLPAQVSAPSSEPLAIEEVLCESKDASERIYVRLNRPVKSAFAARETQFAPAGGVIEVRLPEPLSGDVQRTCFEEGDFEVRGAEGTIRLKTEKDASVTRLGHPDRLLISLE